MHKWVVANSRANFGFLIHHSSSPLSPFDFFEHTASLTMVHAVCVRSERSLDPRIGGWTRIDRFGSFF